MRKRSNAALERAVSLDPNYSFAGAWLIANRVEQGDLAKAYQDAKALVARHPESAQAHFALSYVLRYGGSLERMFSTPTAQLRRELLELNGVGPETADSILLYAGNHAVFVVDAYTRRILERHEMVSSAASYDEIRLLFERALGGLTGPPRQSLDGARPAEKTGVGRWERLIGHRVSAAPRARTWFNCSMKCTGSSSAWAGLIA